MLSIITDNAIPTGVISSLNRQSLEFLTASVFHYYCQTIENDIRGYEHIEWLFGKIKNGEFLSNYLFGDITLVNIEVTDDLMKNVKIHLDETEDSFAILFSVSKKKSGHSRILCKFNGRLYVGDPNIKKFQQIKEHNSLCESNGYPCISIDDSNSNITECLLIARV